MGLHGVVILELEGKAHRRLRESVCKDMNRVSVFQKQQANLKTNKEIHNFTSSDPRRANEHTSAGSTGAVWSPARAASADGQLGFTSIGGRGYVLIGEKVYFCVCNIYICIYSVCVCV